MIPPLPDFKTTWRAILVKLTLDEKLVLNNFLKAHRDALQKNQNQSDMLASIRTENERLRRKRPKTDSDTDVPLAPPSDKPALDVDGTSVQ